MVDNHDEYHLWHWSHLIRNLQRMVAEHNIIKQNETTKAIPFPHLSPEKKTRSQPPSETLVSPGGRGYKTGALAQAKIMNP